MIKLYHKWNKKSVIQKIDATANAVSAVVAIIGAYFIIVHWS